MVKEELLRAGPAGQSYNFADTTVAPAPSRSHFGTVILAIRNQDSCSLDRFHQLPILFPNRFMITKKHDRTRRRFNTESHTPRCMTCRKWPDGHISDHQRETCSQIQVLERDLGRQHLQRHGKAGASVHLSLENGLQSGSLRVQPHHTDPARRNIRRGEKRKSLDMVPMGMGIQKSQADRLAAEFAHQ